jgi:hypothetical protein
MIKFHPTYLNYWNTETLLLKQMVKTVSGNGGSLKNPA